VTSPLDARGGGAAPDGARPPSRNEAELLAEAARLRRGAVMRRTIDRLALFVLLCAIWEGLVDFGFVHPLFISRPSAIAADIYKLFATGYIFPHFAVTIYEAVLGLIVGSLVGVAVGFSAALSNRIADALQPFVVAFNSMPRVALAPLFVIWFGFGPASKIALSALVVFFVMFFNTFSGMRSVDPVLMNSVRVMGASKPTVLWLVNLPFTMAWLFAGLNTSISQALVGAVVGEFIGSTGGLGWIMTQAAGTLDTTRLFSILIILALVGAALFSVMRWAEDYVLRWRPHQET
jgi:NitT/TauT family transport system permease protein